MVTNCIRYYRDFGFDERVRPRCRPKPSAPINPSGPADTPSDYAPADLDDTNIDLGLGCLGDQAVALSSSLLPREISTQEDFGAFSPDDLLKNQNFLDPSKSIGINTVSGSLRNGNQQVRSDPPNPQGRVYLSIRPRSLPTSCNLSSRLDATKHYII